jgi:hypothetical protein
LGRGCNLRTQSPLWSWAAPLVVRITATDNAVLPIPLRRIHVRRLTSIWRSAGWPCRDAIEIDLVAAGWAMIVQDGTGHETIRLTDAGIDLLADARQRNQRCLSAHDKLAARVAAKVTAEGRLVWRELSLRARSANNDPRPASGVASMTELVLWPDNKTIAQPALQGTAMWRMARPDVYSIRRTSVEAYLHPMVHEVKISRADLLSDLRHTAKRESYQWLSCETYYVLPAGIAELHEIPEAFGVWLLNGPIETGTFELARPARHTPCTLPFAVWMALAKATPVNTDDESRQRALGDIAVQAVDDAAVGTQLHGVSDA